MVESPVMWHEGLFLLPHHLQIQSRYHEWYAEQLSQMCLCSDVGYGWKKIRWDEDALLRGEVVLTACMGLFPSGSVLVIDPERDAPLSWTSTTVSAGSVLCVAWPKALKNRPHVGENLEPHHRMKVLEVPVRDTTHVEGNAQTVRVLAPNCRLLPLDACGSDQDIMPIMRILEQKPEGSLVVDESYIPPCLSHRIVPSIVNALERLLHWCRTQYTRLHAQLAGQQRMHISGIQEYMIYQWVARTQAVLQHWQGRQSIHPMEVFQECQKWLGELSLWIPNVLPSVYQQAYRHDQLTETFIPMWAAFERVFTHLFEEVAIKLTCRSESHGYMTVQVPQASYWYERRWILMVYSSLSFEQWIPQFQGHFKIGPAQHIQNMVNLHIPGVPFEWLSAPPQALPYHRDVAYFELDQQSPYFQKMAEGFEMGMHLGKPLPEFSITVWAIQGDRS